MDSLYQNVKWRHFFGVYFVTLFLISPTMNWYRSGKMAYSWSNFTYAIFNFQLCQSLLAQYLEKLGLIRHKWDPLCNGCSSCEFNHKMMQVFICHFHPHFLNLSTILPDPWSLQLKYIEAKGWIPNPQGPPHPGPTR